MIKQLLGGAAICALSMGVAFGQTTLETTTTRTTVAPPPPPPIAGYTTSRTERTTFGGASTEVQQDYRTGPGGTEATKQETIVHPNGASETVSHNERSTPAPIPTPPPALGTISSTTTTWSTQTTR